MLNGKDGGSDLDWRLRRLDEVAWSFDGAKSQSPLSGLHFHPARFISQLPSILISRLSEEGECVVDPFCGSGTTVVEAQRLNRRAFGCDVNPVSVMVTKAKTLQLDSHRAAAILECLTRAVAGADAKALAGVPPTVQATKWYSPPTLTRLAAMHLDIADTEDEEERLLKMLCFSSILLKVCRETRHWGYVCDNTRPATHPERDVVGIVDRAADEIVRALRERGVPGRATTVVESAARSLGDHFPEGSVDLVVTSPPYEGVVDYVKAQRLTFEWLGLDIEQHRLLETGARSKRRRAGASGEFANELTASFAAVQRALRVGGTCAVVFGVSPHRQFTFERLLGIMETVGLRLVGDHTRNVALQRRLMPSVLSERLLILRKDA